VAVVGSVNLDIVARVAHFPRPGETITDAEVSRFPGGKGANQALAAHRLGAEAYLVACVGDDPAAEEALRLLREEHVDLSYCRQLADFSTGLALITVAAGGENQIVVAPGANAAFHADLLELPRVDAVIAQLEVPMDTVLAAARGGDHYFCLNAAPARAVPREVLDHTDLLVVNEIEAISIGASLAVYDGLLATTYGGEGAVLSRHGEEIARARPPRVEVVDTTGAGDAFTAALALGLVGGLEAQAALERACAVGALTTTKPGASTAPRAGEVDSLLA
jgi:ribokinase